MRIVKQIVISIIILVLMVIVAHAGSQTTSSTLASAIITQARSYLNESTASFWSDAEMLIWVNNGSLDIVARTHCLEDVEAETLVDGQILYPLADPFIIIKHVIYDDGKALKRGNIQDIGHVEGEDPDAPLGEPAYWAQWENNVIVYPAPNSTAAGNSIDVYVVDRPAAVASSATVLVPAQYDKVLVYYVVGQAWAKDGKMGTAGSFAKLYLEELDRFRADFNVQPGIPETE